jgi:hypothetical protein
MIAREINGARGTRRKGARTCAAPQRLRKYLVAGREGEHVLACRVCLALEHSSRHLFRSRGLSALTDT